MQGAGIRVLLLVVPLFAATGCFAHRGAHSVSRIWMDYNSLKTPALFLEHIDHLPARRKRVAHYRWMYNKDPGHRYAELGPLPPRPESDCECPTRDDLNGVPGFTLDSGSLWREGIPQPLDAQVMAEGSEEPTNSFSPQGPAAAAPDAATSSDKGTTAVPAVQGGSGGGTFAPADGRSSRSAPLPASPKLPNVPEEYDVPVPPTYGPTAQEWGSFRVIGNQAADRKSGVVNAVPAAEKTPEKIRQRSGRTLEEPRAWLLLR